MSFTILDEGVGIGEWEINIPDAGASAALYLGAAVLQPAVRPDGTGYYEPSP